MLIEWVGQVVLMGGEVSVDLRDCVLNRCRKSGALGERREFRKNEGRLSCP